MCRWGNTDKDRDEINCCLENFNSEAEKYRQLVEDYQNDSR